MMAIFILTTRQLGPVPANHLINIWSNETLDGKTEAATVAQIWATGRERSTPDAARPEKDVPRSP